MRRVRDFAEVKNQGQVNVATVKAALQMLEIDSLGLDFMDRKFLLTIIQHFSGGPVGVANLAAAIGETIDTLEDTVEPYLIQQGFIQRTPRGRMVTDKAYQHFNLPSLTLT